MADDVDEFMADLGRDIAERLDRAGSFLEIELKRAVAGARLSEHPKRTGMMAAKIGHKVIMENDTKGLVIVWVPFPWQFYEYGYVDRGGAFHQPNGIARRTFASNEDNLNAILSEETSG